MKWYGDFIGTDTLIADIVTLINDVVDEKGDFLFSAVNMGSSVLRVTANSVEQDLYGRGLLEVFYSADGTIDNCDDSLEATVVENPIY